MRKLKFSLVGLISMAVSFGSLYLMIDVLGWNRGLGYAVQTVLAIECNYLLNSRFTWGDRSTGTPWQRWLRFHSARFGIMIPVNQLAFFWLQPRLGTLLANACCIGAATLVNWFINDRWVFKMRPEVMAGRAGGSV